MKRMSNTLDYQNPLRNQCMSLPELCEPQLAGVRKGIEGCIPPEKAKGIRRVIFTGCGDSYFAGRVVIPAYKHFAGQFGSHFAVERCIDVGRFLPMSEKEAAATLVIGISASGGPARVEEALLRARKYGYMTMALTNNPDSRAAAAAEYSLIVNTPSFENPNPGLRNYYASLIGLLMFGAYLGECKGISPAGTMDKLADAIRAYTKSYDAVLPEIDEKMFVLAQTWKDYTAIDTIADDINASTAMFVGAKFLEVAGILSTYSDSEDWCHVNYFAHNPEQIGTIIVADKYDNNRSRIAETVHQASGIDRPVLLVANGAKKEFGINEDIIEMTVPEAPEGYEFLLPLLNYIPGSILSSYVSALLGEPYFRAGKGHWADEGVGTIRSSKVVIL